MAAQSAKNSDSVFGVMYKRFRARQGPSQATVSTAHAIARIVYRMLKYKVEYETISVNEYEKKYEEQQVKYFKKKAAKLGYLLVPAWARSERSSHEKRRLRDEDALFAFNCLQEFYWIVALRPKSAWFCMKRRVRLPAQGAHDNLVSENALLGNFKLVQYQ